MAEMILARISRCRYCGREMTCAPLEYEQNPFCTTCLPDRVGKAMPQGRISWRTEGQYSIPEVSQRRSLGVRKRRRG